MEPIFERQSILTKEIERINVNFRKDSVSRKTSEYLLSRLAALDKLWKEFEENHKKLLEFEDDQYEYFSKGIYQYMKDYCIKTKEMMSSYKEPKMTTFTLPTFEDYSYQGDDLLSQQETNFRALDRLFNRINIEDLEEKWELEDELKNLQNLWKIIETVHLRLDNQLKGSDVAYEDKFLRIEERYHAIKRELNRKLNSTAHLQQATPKLEVPTFYGKYTQWPTFFDLFVETIHNNKCLSKAQKMQHLKGRVKGEAEGLIQHLHITSENYETAWDILTHRYNNPQILFSTQMDIFLNQPSINKHSSYHTYKKLHDTTTQCINAIRNLGIDITTWDPIIVHLLSKKLDEETRTKFLESRQSPRDLISYSEFLHFIENKFMAREPVGKKEKPVSESYRPNTSHPRPNSYNYSPKNTPFQKKYQTNATYNRRSCPVCKAPHDLYQCKRFLTQSADRKLNILSKHDICHNCLYNHYGNKCISTKRCKECKGNHNSIIHDAIITTQRDVRESSPKLLESNPTSRHSQNVNYVASENEEVLLTTVALNIKTYDGSYMQFRALLDQGSQISLISENAAQLLGLKRRNYRVAVSGIGSTHKQGKGLVSLECVSIYGDYQFTTDALVVSRVINNLPNVSFKKQSWPHLSHTKLADPEYNISKPIDLLLDASVYSDIIMSGLIKGPVQAPIAQQTRLGWILSGNVKTFACHVVINDINNISRFWEVEDIHQSSSSLSSADQYCEEYYQSTTRRLESGQYEVALPMKPDFEQEIGASKSRAIAQFIQQEKKMSKDPALAEGYRKFMREYEELGHMRKVEHQHPLACYLPHHGVLKLDSTTTALRVVFNASSKMLSGRSLNDLMYSGPNLQQDLQNLILKWRQYKYVVTADVEKMFRAIYLRPQDQPLQSILWRARPNESLNEYHLTTVTYGTRAAPFLAMRTLKQIGIDHADQYPLAASALESSFYMDDYLGGSNSLQLAKQSQQELIDVLRGAGMNLRKWSSNNPQLIENLQPDLINAPFEFKDTESRKTLGLRWIPSTDTFTFDSKIEPQGKDKPITKRQLLSDISKIFDPLGWLSPLTIRAKILFQTTWTAHLSWDEDLPAEIALEWKRLREDLININMFSIPRYLGRTEKAIQLHGFSDSSEKAYASTIYIVTHVYKGTRTSKLLTAKTKVAPVNKSVTLPRLELLGALLLAQLMEKLIPIFASEKTEVFAWTDSMVVLGWLHGDLSKWKPFVANRVQKIINVIPASNWRHVKSCDNAADCATRGLSSDSLLQNRLWWEGPEWLTNFSPDHISKTNYRSPTAEMKKSSVHTTLYSPQSTFINELLNKFNSITKVVRTVAWVSRYIASLRNKNSRAVGALSGVEIQSALYLVIKHAQIIDFNEDISQLKKRGFVRSSSNLSCLRPFLDSQGILRVGGRLEQANITYAAKHPIILSPKSRLAELIIYQAHINTLHGGPRLTLSFIREKYWLISGISSVKKQLRSCVKCRRYSQESYQQLMADLPKPRITPSRPFTNVGIDFTGHVDIKSNKGRGIRTTKGYVAVFVCLATKAVHIELVSDLSTASFLGALRRMCARRGVPKNIYSDNGTNFVGASRLLKQEYREIMASINPSAIIDVTNLEISWHFNAPAWPNAGGLWEAAVKSLKYHLKRVLGDQKLTYEEFTTLLCQIEACLNSRPLCALTENPDDTYLTPGHFLVGGSLLSRPQTDPEHINLTTRWQLIQSMNKQFWKKWSSEYLQQLQSRTKWRTTKKNLNVGDLVLIKENNMPPGKWAMARVLALHPGQDGYVRVVTLKTANNTIKRPVNQLIPLPVQENSGMRETTDTDSSQRISSPRRHSQSKFNLKTLFASALLLLMMIISPSMQQSSIKYNITSLDNHKNLFFDRVSELQHIKDEWKLIVYYNISTYWSGFTELDYYVRHLNKLCQNTSLQSSRMPYKAIVLQLQHELNELEHYNSLLRNPNKRYKRGLVNGVGNLASYLFGVLDDKFAERYKLDIEQISQNENHLQNLIKNQTLIIEAECNVIRRNEAIMNQQFTFMNKQMKSLLHEVNNVQSDTAQGLYLTSSALSAFIVLSNLRRMQQNLIDVITDIYHGRIDTHLFSPDDLESQINIISREIQDDLKIPLDKSSITSLYKLLRVYARVYEDYLIMEIKIPLVTTEKYELDRVISLQRKESEGNHQVISTYPYLAFNLRKNLVSFLTYHDLQLCLHANPEMILCTIDKPIYDIREKQSICDIKLNGISPCISKESECGDSKWIKLRRPNDWLYQCCKQCTVRIFSARDTEVKTLSGNGIISLCPGCTLKGDSFKIYSHNNFMNHVDRYAEDLTLPQVSVVNEILNTSIPIVESFTPEDHHEMWNQVKSEIEDLKQQSTQTLSIHDVHQYSVLYSLVAGAFLTGLVLTIIWRRRRRGQQSSVADVPTIPKPQPITQPRRISESNSIKFDIPLSE